MPRPSLLTSLTFAFIIGCAAVFPELATRMDKAPAAAKLDPPPPPDRHFVRVVKARVPPRTRDGREWDQVLGSLPDPYVKLILNDTDLLKTHVATNTLEPSWETSPKGNFRIVPGDELEIQLWDSGPLADTPIGIKKVKLERQMFEGEIEFALSGEASVTLELKPAEAIWGAGFWYELRNSGARVTRVVDQSPATRAGFQPGDEIVELGGRQVSEMSPDEVRSVLGAIPVDGVAMSVRHPDGNTVKATIKAGPIYPLFSEYDSLPVKP